MSIKEAKNELIRAQKSFESGILKEISPQGGEV